MSLKSDITDFIVSHMSRRENNTLGEIDLPAFGTPITGVADADDPLFAFYKKHIDENFYRLPSEWLKAVCPDFGGDASVVSWVLPQTEDTKRKCREHGDCPSYEWLLARVKGEDCNRRLATAVRDYLRSLGLKAVAPMVEPEFAWSDSERFLKVSNWSERHTAYICGLGTFGLCDGLITPVGKAVRIGSVIVGAKLGADKRPYSEYNEYCQHKNGCKACILRCPAGAITDKGHDKAKCIAYHAEHIKPIAHDRYGYDGYAVCGLCQTGVPCESCIPKKEK